MVRPYGMQGYKRKAGGVAFEIARPAKRFRARRFLVARAAGRARLRRRNLRTAGFLGIEKKFYDTYLTNQAIVATTNGAEVDPAADLSCLNAIAQGDGESNRDGRRCILKSVYVKGVLEASGVADAADPQPAKVVRVIMVLDRQTNGVQLNSEDVLKDSAGSDVNSFTNLQHSGRFRIMYDRTFVIPTGVVMADGANTGSQQMGKVPFKIYRNLNIPVTFDGTTENIANITDNSLHMLAICDNATGIPKISYQARVRFVG